MKKVKMKTKKKTILVKSILTSIKISEKKSYIKKLSLKFTSEKKEV